VGYGGMVGEGLLALTSILATTAGFALYVGVDGWHEHYASFASASTGGVNAFVDGVGSLCEGIGIPHEVAAIFAAVVVISFAVTTMDTGVRLQRYILEELGSQYRIKVLRNGIVATLAAALCIGVLALGVDRGAGGMRIWPLFGTTNQLTGALTLLVVSAFLWRLKRNVWVTAVPMVFLFVMTTWAMLEQLAGFFRHQWMLFGVGALIFVLEVWLILEAIVAFRKMFGGGDPGTPEENVVYDALGTE
jgi:carbon starvation protein